MIFDPDQPSGEPQENVQVDHWRHEMDYFVVVQARGKGLDRLRGEAYRVSRDARKSRLPRRADRLVRRAKKLRNSVLL